MPVYTYVCPVCGVRFDAHRHFGQPHHTICPEGHDGAQRVFSPPTIIFKGSGFYSTDNGRNGLVSRASASGKPSEPEKSPSKTESKSEKAA